jgi:DNA mismatch endonuclease Vsr
MDKLTPEQRKKNMRAVKSKGSKIERLLAKELWSNGLRYRKNDRSVFGCPDFVFKRLKIAVFCDSEFWHGKDWELQKHGFKSNREFWFQKIERNMKRDREVNEKLLKDGWKVIRFWGKEIEKNPYSCMLKIKDEVIRRRNEIQRVKRKNIY